MFLCFFVLSFLEDGTHQSSSSSSELVGGGMGVAGKEMSNVLELRGERMYGGV